MAGGDGERGKAPIARETALLGSGINAGDRRFHEPTSAAARGPIGLTAAEDLSHKGTKIAEAAIDTVEQALEGTDYESAKQIRPSHLKVEIVREEGKTYPRWQVAKLLRPRSNRPPTTANELVDWVEG